MDVDIDLANYKDVGIELHLRQDPDGAWTGRCSLVKPDGTREEFKRDPRVFLSMEDAKESALEDAPSYIVQNY